MDYTTIQNAATKIVDNIKVIDGSINALQNKQDIISTSDMSMVNSHEGKLKIEEISGKCEQVITTGKNLLDYTGVTDSLTSNGVTFTKIYDNDGNLEYVNVNGTATADAMFGVTNEFIHISSGESYILSGCPSGGNSSTYRLRMYNFDGNRNMLADNGNGSEFTFTNTTNDYNIVIDVRSGYTANNLKFYPMVRLASIADSTYEPYTGGIPAPNPDYPQEIKKVVVSEVKTHGKNLVNNTAVSQTISGLTFTVNSDGSVIVNGKSPDDANVIFGLDDTIGERLTIGDTYILSGCPSGGSKDTYRLDCVRQGVTAYMVDSGERSRYTVTENTISPRIRIWIGKGITINNLIFYPMLCKAAISDNTYEPYTESTIKLSEPIELYGIGDVKDTIEDGKVVRKFATTILDDAGGYRYFNKAISCNIVDNLIKPSDSNYVIPKILSEKFSPDTPSNVLNGANENRITVSIAADTYRIRLHSDSLTSAEEAISYFTENPMTVVYELAEPVTEPLPAVDQIALNNLSTYDGTTYVEIDSEIEPTFQAEYGVTEIGGRVLEDLMTGLNSEILAQSDADRIAALESTIVNNI